MSRPTRNRRSIAVYTEDDEKDFDKLLNAHDPWAAANPEKEEKPKDDVSVDGYPNPNENVSSDEEELLVDEEELSADEEELSADEEESSAFKPSAKSARALQPLKLNNSNKAKGLANKAKGKGLPKKPEDEDTEDEAEDLAPLPMSKTTYPDGIIQAITAIKDCNGSSIVEIEAHMSDNSHAGCKLERMQLCQAAIRLVKAEALKKIGKQKNARYKIVPEKLAVYRVKIAAGKVKNGLEDHRAVNNAKRGGRSPAELCGAVCSNIKNPCDPNQPEGKTYGDVAKFHRGGGMKLKDPKSLAEMLGITVSDLKRTLKNMGFEPHPKNPRLITDGDTVWLHSGFFPGANFKKISATHRKT